MRQKVLMTVLLVGWGPGHFGFSSHFSHPSLSFCHTVLCAVYPAGWMFSCLKACALPGLLFSHISNDENFTSFIEFWNHYVLLGSSFYFHDWGNWALPWYHSFRGTSKLYAFYGSCTLAWPLLIPMRGKGNSSSQLLQSHDSSASIKNFFSIVPYLMLSDNVCNTLKCLLLHLKSRPYR